MSAIYGQSSLRLHHLNYFLHVLKLFKPYISEKFRLPQIKKFMDKRTKVQLQPVRSIFKLYPYLVLTIIEVNIMNCRQKKISLARLYPQIAAKKLTASNRFSGSLGGSDGSCASKQRWLQHFCKIRLGFLQTIL